MYSNENPFRLPIKCQTSLAGCPSLFTPVYFMAITGQSDHAHPYRFFIQLYKEKHSQFSRHYSRPLKNVLKIERTRDISETTRVQLVFVRMNFSITQTPVFVPHNECQCNQRSCGWLLRLSPFLHAPPPPTPNTVIFPGIFFFFFEELMYFSLPWEGGKCPSPKQPFVFSFTRPLLRSPQRPRLFVVAWNWPRRYKLRTLEKHVNECLVSSCRFYSDLHFGMHLWKLFAIQ